MPAFDPDELRAAICKKLSDRTTVVGAQLGAHIKEFAPDVDLRADYGGLKPFVAQFLSPHIIWIGKSGLDDLYRVDGDGASPHAGLVPAAAASNNLWQIFANPSHPGGLFVDTNAGELFLTLDDSALQKTQSNEAFRQVRRLSATQQKEIAAEWVKTSSLDSDDRTDIQRILEGDGYWWRLFNWFRSKASPEVRESWVAHRHNRIRQEFAVALEDAGVSAEHIATLGRLLLNSKKKGTPKNVGIKKGRDQTSEQNQKMLSLSHRPLSLRMLAQECIVRLSNEQLRDLRIPLGVVWDVLSDSGK